jgi:hypothetical protein
MIIIFSFVFIIISRSSIALYCNNYNALAFPETEAASLRCLIVSKVETYQQFCKHYCSREYLAPVGAENKTFLKHRVRSFPQ